MQEPYAHAVADSEIPQVRSLQVPGYVCCCGLLPELPTSVLSLARKHQYSGDHVHLSSWLRCRYLYFGSIHRDFRSRFASGHGHDRYSLLRQHESRQRRGGERIERRNAVSSFSSTQFGT